MAYTIPPQLLQLQASIVRRQQNDDKFRQRMFAEFLDKMEGIFGEGRLPVFVPSAVMLATQERIPMMPWGNLAHRMEPEEESQWLVKMGEALSQGGCIQVKLGGNSFSLCVLDVDDDALVEPLLQANPRLGETLQTRGSKGRHFWFYAADKPPFDYPRKKRQIVCQGKIIEFLTDGNLCTIWGTHYKTGEQYQVIHAAKPILLPFDDIQLPAGGEWKSRPSRNGEWKGHGHTHGTADKHGGFDWDAYNAAREAQEGVVEVLVEEYFPYAKKVGDGWQCADITGEREGKSFTIDRLGHCREWGDEEDYQIMNAITSDERVEKLTREDVFTFLAEEGLNFFLPPPLDAVTFPGMEPGDRPVTICYDNDFTCNGREYQAGVYWHGTLPGKGKDDPDIPIDNKICSPIKGAAITHTKEVEEYSLLLDFVPKGKTEWRKILLTRASLVATRSDEARTQLASAGVEFLSGDWKPVHDYIEQQNPADYLIQVKLTGWVNKDFQTFILPHVTLGKTTETYFDPGLESVEYGISGTLEEWKEKVAVCAVGNNWLLFGLSVALVGPLLEPLNLTGTGYHWYGDSSMGKTTVLREATSVWGAAEYLKTWRTTSNGLEITCAKRSGTLLVLDEADEATAETVYASLYMISNGRGKSRMQKDITERPTFNWRVCALSSGERTLEAQITENGRGKYKVGQEMRMVPLDPTKSKHGVFDELHGHANGAEFSQHLSHEAAKFYGNAGIQFIEA